MGHSPSLAIQGRTIRKVMGGRGGGGFSNIFLGLIGVQEFFSFNFPLREFFLYFFFLMNVCVAGEGKLLSEEEARIYGQLYYLKTEATVNSPRVIYESLYGK